MGLEAMTKTEMLDILRGKKLIKAPENNDELIEGLKMLDTIFDEIADELEQSERVVRCKDCRYFREKDNLLAERKDGVSKGATP